MIAREVVLRVPAWHKMLDAFSDDAGSIGFDLRFGMFTPAPDGF